MAVNKRGEEGFVYFFFVMAWILKVSSLYRFEI
jgi:hypothetical protein